MFSSLKYNNIKMNDFIISLLWCTVNLAMLRTAWIVVRHFYPGDTPAQCIGHVVAVMWAALVLICIALGSIGALRPIWMGAGGFILAWTGIAWVARHSSKLHASTFCNQNHGDKSWGRRAILLGWGFLGTVIGVVIIEKGVLQFPSDWDSLMYHIPHIDQWLQCKSLFAPADAVWYFPGNAELVGLWLVAPFSGDFWVGLTNAPIALFLIFGTLELGRELGMTPLLRHATAATVLSNHIFFRQIATNENDLAVAGLFVAGIMYGLRYARYKYFADMGMTAITLGLLAGVKYYALGYAAVAWVGVLSLTHHRSGWRESFRLMAAGALATVAFAAYWYGRNLWLTGTPLYPLGFTERTNLLEQFRPGILNSSLVGNGRIELLPLWLVAIWKMAGPCQSAAIITLPLSLAWLLCSRLRSSKERNSSASETDSRWVLAILLIGSLIIFGITPNTIDPMSQGRLLNSDYLTIRFSQSPLILSVLAFGITLHDLAIRLRCQQGYGTRLRRIISMAPAAIFVGLTLAQAINSITDAARQISLVVLLASTDIVAIGILIHETLGLFHSRRAVASYLLSGLIMTSVASEYLSRNWHQNFSRYYDHMFSTSIYSNIEKKYKSKMIAVLDFRYYPYFGSRRQCRVIRPWAVRSESSLLSYLYSHHVDLVAVVRNDEFYIGRYRNAYNLFINNKFIFDHIDSGDKFEIYIVHRKNLKNRLSVF